jgi:hypothetical protein
VDILTHLGIIKDRVYPDILNPQFGSKGNTFNSCIHRAKEINKPFNLTLQQFTHVKTFGCYLCGISDKLNHKNGLDRIDSQLGYTLSNILACCAGCNYFKNNYAIDIFINHLVVIYNHNLIFNQVVKEEHPLKRLVTSDIGLTKLVHIWHLQKIGFADEDIQTLLDSKTDLLQYLTAFLRENDLYYLSNANMADQNFWFQLPSYSDESIPNSSQSISNKNISTQQVIEEINLRMNLPDQELKARADYSAIHKILTDKTFESATRYRKKRKFNISKLEVQPHLEVNPIEKKIASRYLEMLKSKDLISRKT